MSRAFTRSRNAAVIALTAGSLSLTACGATKTAQTAISQATSAAVPTSSSTTHSTSSTPTSPATSSSSSTTTTSTSSPAPVTRTVTVTATAQPTSATSQAVAPATKTPSASASTGQQLPVNTTTRASSTPAAVGTATTALGAIAPTVIVKAMNTSGNVALLRNTANTMHCEITTTYAACGSDPLIASRAITPASSIDPVWWAQVGLSGRGVAESKADALESAGTTLDPQHILAGQSVTYGGFTCTERTSGTTCVNTRTGHGFLINSRTIKPF